MSREIPPSRQVLRELREQLNNAKNFCIVASAEGAPAGAAEIPLLNGLVGLLYGLPLSERLSRAELFLRYLTRYIAQEDPAARPIISVRQGAVGELYASLRAVQKLWESSTARAKKRARKASRASADAKTATPAH